MHSYWLKIWTDSELRPNWECQPSWVLRLNRYCALSSRGTQPTGLDQGPMGLRTSRWKRLSKNISKQYCQNIFLLLGAHLLLFHWLGATCEEVSFPALPTNRGGRWRISFRHRVHEQVHSIGNHQFWTNQSIHQIIHERYYYNKLPESFWMRSCKQTRPGLPKTLLPCRPARRRTNFSEVCLDFHLEARFV